MRPEESLQGKGSVSLTFLKRDLRSSGFAGPVSTKMALVAAAIVDHFTASHDTWRQELGIPWPAFCRILWLAFLESGING